MRSYAAKSVTIFSDSQSAISALAGFKIKSKTVANCIDNLNSLGETTTVEIKYIQAHRNHTGNEVADCDAKLGTKNTYNKVNIPPPISWAKLILKQELY